MGLDPPNTEVGDVVAVMFGISLPMMLRLADRYFKYVGVSYVDGIMNGEGTELDQAEGKTDDEFILI
jgi:hypothetical protein